MRLPSKRKSILVAVVLLLVGAGAVLGYLWSSHPRANRTEPELLEIAVYPTNHTAQGIRVCFPDRVILIMSANPEKNYRRELRRFEMTEAEMDRLKGIVDSAPGLRSFNPKSRWLRKVPTCTDYATTVTVFAWSDRTRAYYHPYFMDELPQYARDLYKLMDDLFAVWGPMLKDRPCKTTVLSESDPLYKEHLRRWDEAFRISLPK